ncbi:A/G-specific adenine glycosylase [Namhaeicola litoreus]|uniref:Adenine DNA glycosylase n=1 Tax=Namhaeicola litoreus TaxID=1052145 RepID=A0ABW3XWW9_9FLAO
MIISNLLISWYLANKRELPWRQTKDPYTIWLSEVILQQTRIAQGTAYFIRFTKEFPTVFDLATANEDEVLKLWQGLGYYSRARNLHYTAKYIVNELNGVFPNSYKSLKKMKGIGDYTASAIASICFNEVQAVVDGNVYRVLSRYFNVKTAINSSRGIKEFKEIAQNIISKENPGLHNEAIMELGALICTPKNPNCGACPLSGSCLALKKNKIDSLPLKLKKTKIRTRYFNFLVVNINNQSTILEQRKENDIWKHLYQFPLVESNEELSHESILTSDNLEKLIQDKSLQLKLFNQNNIVHILTHQKILAKFWIINTKSDHKNAVEWNNVSNFAVPVIISNFLEKFR